MTADRELLRRTAEGDDDAFALFYRRHVGAVLAFHRRRVPEAELAFDLTAETFAAVVVAAGTWREEAEPVAWLFGIARNKLREALRVGRVRDDARRRLAWERQVLDDEALERVEERAAAGDVQLAGALATLAPEVREAVLARVVEDEDYDGIARRLRCSPQVARQRVSRGLRRLRASLEEGR